MYSFFIKIFITTDKPMYCKNKILWLVTLVKIDFLPKRMINTLDLN